MGTRGPARTPTATLRARGSWRATARGDEPQPTGELPPAPDWLCDSAKLIYEALRGNAGIAALCTAADVSSVAHLSDCLDTMNRCKSAETVWEPFITGNGAAGLHPLQKLWIEASAQATKLEQQLGFNPSGRAGLAVGTMDKKFDSCFAM